MKSYFIYTLLFVAAGNVVWAQNVNSVYSSYGIGDVNIRDWNGYSSMGGLGIALKSERTLNDLNPASYGGLKNNRYILEINGVGTHVNYVTENDNISAGDFQIKRAAMGMNLFKNLGTVFGVKQYSNIAYQSNATRYIAGTDSKLGETITGTGGLNLAYLGNGYNIGKHLSVGVTTGILFGSVNKTENVVISASDGLNIVNNTFYNKFYVNTGLQYQFKTGKTQWILGGTFQPGINLKQVNDFSINDLNETVLTEDQEQVSKFKYPLQFGGGITMIKGHSKIGADYIQQNWSGTGYKGTGFTTTNLQNAALGYSYTFHRKTYYGPVEGVSLMAGLQRDLSYIVINNQQVSSTIGTIGANFPSKTGLFNYSLGLRFGQRGKIMTPLVKEKFIDFTLNISLSNVFFIGGRKFD